MSHQVLARKWRPREFASLAGQEHVVRALTHALQTGRLHHAYLFTGTRGVGKTSIARILAKALNCELGVGPTPCGRCSACVGIDAGRFPDYVEMDAASNRGVEEMAQLLEAAVYAPVVGRTKVYVIDEVHMLSTHAFNAMLKTLEEPPAHVVFVLATTDAQKVPVTVLSRCLQFSLKNMAPATIAERLTEVLTAEGIAFEAQALHEIGAAAAGSMRDALSLLDQAIAHGGGEVRADSVRAMIGAVGRDDVAVLLDALVAGDAEGLIARAEAMLAEGLAAERTLAAFAVLMQRIALVQAGVLGSEGALAGSTDSALAERQRMANWAEQIDAEDLQVWWQIAIHGGRDLPWAPDPATGLTMTLLRMLAFRPVAVPTRPREAVAPLPTPPGPMEAATSPPEPAAAKPPLAVAAPPSVVAAPRQAFDGDWPALARQLSVNGIARQCVERSALVSFEPDAIVLRAPIRAMTETSVVTKVRDALSAHFGRPIRLTLLSGEVEGPTVAGLDHALQQERLEQARGEIVRDPFVQTLMQDFGAQIVPGSIQPNA